MEFDNLRTQVYETAMRLCEAGLIRLSAGNISARDEPGHVAITPTSLLYTKMRPADIVIIDLEGRVVDGSLKPSSEVPMHTAIYRALPKVGAVVHTHSIYAIAFAASGAEIPPICLEILSVTGGGAVPVSSFAAPGSNEAGITASQIFSSRPTLKALLLRNHGLVSIGADLEQAYQMAYKCETGAQIYHLSLQTGKPPVPLSQEQIAEISATRRKG